MSATLQHPLRITIAYKETRADATYPVTDYNNGGMQATRFHVLFGASTVADKLIDTEPIDLRVATLEGRKIVVLLDTFTGGAHCCFETTIADAKGVAGPTIVTNDWGNPGYALMISKDRSGYVFRTADDAMAYAFSSFAASRFPIRIVEYRTDDFIDVTNEYKTLVENDAASQWKEYLTDASSGAAPESALVAFLADEYRLGLQDSGWKRVRASYGSDAIFENRARSWLEKNGYKVSPAPPPH
jgi:hypothetical protein